MRRKQYRFPLLNIKKCIVRIGSSCRGTLDLIGVALVYISGRVFLCIKPTWRGDVVMNKSDLIEAIAKSADISKAAAGRALDATVESIKKALKKGDTVSLVGFGTFKVGKRAARNGRNPRTGATIKIKAAKVPKFRAGKGLKDAVN